MENEDDALDLLLSLQSDYPVLHTAPLKDVDAQSESNPVSTDVVEVGGITLQQKSGVTQESTGMVSTTETCSETAALSLPIALSAPSTDPGDAG